jgi:hypothetical protein
MNYRDIKLSTLGLIIAIILTLIGYVLYYILFYPELTKVQSYQAYTSYQEDNKDVEVNISAPIYLASYQPSLFAVNIRNMSNQELAGNIIITPALYNNHNEKVQKNPWMLIDSSVNDDKNFILIPTSQQIFTFILEPGKSVDHFVGMQLPSDDIEFSIISIQIEIVDSSFSKIVKWENEGFQYSSESYCTQAIDKEIYNKDSKENICIEKSSYGVFVYSALQKMLLPPFANFILIFLVFSFVWLAEQVLPKEWIIDNAWFTVAYILLLTLLPSLAVYLLSVCPQRLLDKYSEILMEAF